MDDRFTLLHVDASRLSHRMVSSAVAPVASYHAVSCVDEARRYCAAHSVAFFMVDHTLPDGTGLQFIEHLRSQEAHAETPIILYSSEWSESLAHRAMHAGANLSLRKPTDAMTLCQHVAELFALPTVTRVRPSLVQMNCWQWHTEQGTHIFSPDLNVSVSAASPEKAHELLQARIDEARQAGRLSAQVIEPQRVKFIVSLDSDDPASAA